jgi:hypothetical protein
MRATTGSFNQPHLTVTQGLARDRVPSVCDPDVLAFVNLCYELLS